MNAAILSSISLALFDLVSAHGADNGFNLAEVARASRLHNITVASFCARYGPALDAACRPMGFTCTYASGKFATDPHLPRLLAEGKASDVAGWVVSPSPDGRKSRQKVYKICLLNALGQVTGSGHLLGTLPECAAWAAERLVKPPGYLAMYRGVVANNGVWSAPGCTKTMQFVALLLVSSNAMLSI